METATIGIPYADSTDTMLALYHPRVKVKGKIATGNWVFRSSADEQYQSSAHLPIRVVTNLGCDRRSVRLCERQLGTVAEWH